MTNPQDDGEAVAFNIDEIMLEAERRHHEWNRPGVTGQAVRPEQAIEYWYALVAHEKAAATLSRQLAEARAWVRDLQSGMYVNCVYCGHRYGPGETTPVSMADALKAHVEQCPAHPMSKLRKELAEARGVIERQRIALREIEQLAGYGVQHDLGDAILIAQAALSPPREQHGDKG